MHTLTVAFGATEDDVVAADKAKRTIRIRSAVYTSNKEWLVTDEVGRHTAKFSRAPQNCCWALVRWCPSGGWEDQSAFVLIQFEGYEHLPLCSASDADFPREGLVLRGCTSIPEV